MSNNKKIKVGVSSCLLGNNVRFNGGHKRSDKVISLEADNFELVPTCPEVEAGLPVPRTPIRLVGDHRNPKVVYVNDHSKEVTEQLNDFANDKVKTLCSLSGFVFKKDSPSCGLFRVKVYENDNYPKRNGMGVFAAKVTSNFPLMPVEEEGRLNNPELRNNFIERVCVYNAWQALKKSGITVSGLLDFHRIHKMLLLSHDEPTYGYLGSLVAQARHSNLETMSYEYISGLMEALKILPTTGRHANVLFRIMGFLKTCIAKSDRRELSGLINSYAEGNIPLMVPVSLIRHHLRLNPVDYLLDQYYLSMRFDKLESCS